MHSRAKPDIVMVHSHGKPAMEIHDLALIPCYHQFLFLFSFIFRDLYFHIRFLIGAQKMGMKTQYSKTFYKK